MLRISDHLHIGLSAVAGGWGAAVIWASGLEGAIFPAAIAVCAIAGASILASWATAQRKVFGDYAAGRLSTNAFMERASRVSRLRLTARGACAVAVLAGTALLPALAAPGQMAVAPVAASCLALAVLRAGGLLRAGADRVYLIDAVLPDDIIFEIGRTQPSSVRFSLGWTTAGRIEGARRALALHSGIKPQVRSLADAQYAPQAAFAPVIPVRKSLRGEALLMAMGWRLAGLCAAGAAVLALLLVLLLPPGGLGRVPPLGGDWFSDSPRDPDVEPTADDTETASDDETDESDEDDTPDRNAAPDESEGEGDNSGSQSPAADGADAASGDGGDGGGAATTGDDGSDASGNEGATGGDQGSGPGAGEQSGTTGAAEEGSADEGGRGADNLSGEGNPSGDPSSSDPASGADETGDAAQSGESDGAAQSLPDAGPGIGGPGVFAGDGVDLRLPETTADEAAGDAQPGAGAAGTAGEQGPALSPDSGTAGEGPLADGRDSASPPPADDAGGGAAPGANSDNPDAGPGPEAGGATGSGGGSPATDATGAEVAPGGEPQGSGTAVPASGVPSGASDTVSDNTGPGTPVPGTIPADATVIVAPAPPGSPPGTPEGGPPLSLSGEGSDLPPEDVLPRRLPGAPPDPSDPLALQVVGPAQLFAESGSVPDGIEARLPSDSDQPIPPPGGTLAARQILPAWINDLVNGHDNAP